MRRGKLILNVKFLKHDDGFTENDAKHMNGEICDDFVIIHSIHKNKDNIDMYVKSIDGSTGSDISAERLFKFWIGLGVAILNTNKSNEDDKKILISMIDQYNDRISKNLLSLNLEYLPTGNLPN